MKHYNIQSFSIRNFLFLIPLLLLAFTTGDSKSEYNVPIKAFSVNTSDIDLDGDKDIIIGHLTAWQQQNPTVSILNNYSNGIFNIIDTSLIFSGYQENIFAIKINNDNYPDLVTFYSDFSSGTAERYIRIYYNENGEFNNYTNFNLNSSETFTTINYGDINGDSYYDLVVISNQGKFWGVLYNDGTGNFSPPQYHSVSDYYPSDIACADLNDDGREDIVIGGKTEIFFSYETGFQSLFFNTITSDIETVDFDNDGDIDIIGAHQPLPSNYYLVTLIENLGNENFTIHPSFIFQPVCNRGLTVSDFNNDSLPDLLFQTQDMQHLLIFFNKGNFDIADSVFIPMADYGETTRRSACADFDGNGYNDIVTIRSWGAPLPANVNILFNDGNGNFLEDPITKIPRLTDAVRQENSIVCYPNPFTTETTISFTIKEKGKAQLKVFDLNGKLVHTITNNELQKGNYKFKWDGTDKNGKEVKTGVYIVKLVTGRQNYSCRIIYSK